MVDLVVQRNYDNICPAELVGIVGVVGGWHVKYVVSCNDYRDVKVDPSLQEMLSLPPSRFRRCGPTASCGCHASPITSYRENVQLSEYKTIRRVLVVQQSRRVQPFVAPHLGAL